jgi:hypothetical protein
MDFRTNPNGSVRARTRFRDADGQLRPVEATGPSTKAAERNLIEKIARRGHYATGIGELSPDTTFAKLVEVWLEDLISRTASRPAHVRCMSGTCAPWCCRLLSATRFVRYR